MINETSAQLLDDNTTSLLGFAWAGHPPGCKLVALEAKEETSYVSQSQTDSNHYSVMLASGITKADDDVGKCLRAKRDDTYHRRTLH